MPHSLVQSLQRVPEFAPLDERTLLAIVGESMNLVWRDGSTIFEPGLPGDALYIVLSGEVLIDNGTEQVARLGVGDFFGEISLLLNTTHHRRARAVGECELLVLPKEAFMAVLHTNGRLAQHFDALLHARQPDGEDATDLAEE